MSKKTSRIIVAAFCVFVAAVIALFSVVIGTSPEVPTALTAGNYPGTLANGGMVLDDEGFLFYIQPKTGGLYRVISEDFSDPVLIAENAAGNLQIVGSTYYYEAKDSALYSCRYDGSEQTKLITYAANAQVVGSSIYYLDKDNMLCRADRDGDNQRSLGLQTAGDMLVYMRKIYYTAQDGTLWRADIDGENSEAYINKQVDHYFLDGSYLFYKTDGVAYSYNKTVSERIIEADAFITKNNYLLYQTSKGLHIADMDRLGSKKHKPVKIDETGCSGFGLDDNYFYYFNSEDKLCKVALGGSGKVKTIG